MQCSGNESTSPHAACQLSASGWQPAETKKKCRWQTLVVRRVPRCPGWLQRQAFLARYMGFCVWGRVEGASLF